MRLMQMVEKQTLYATGRALGNVALHARDALPAESRKSLDRPTPFTQHGFFARRPRRGELEAEVGVKDRQREYLQWPILGGLRRPRRKALRLPFPKNITMDAYGNLPRNTIARLVKAAEKGRLHARTAKSLGISKKVPIFYGDPGDGRPPGLFKRVGDEDNERLISLISFPAISARYKAQFDIRKPIEHTVMVHFQDEFSRELGKAFATARIR